MGKPGSEEPSSIWGPLFVIAYLTFGIFCIKAPITVQKEIIIKLDEDWYAYERARFLHAQGSIHEAVELYVKLVQKGYTEILDILINIFYYGVDGVIAPNQEATETLFSLRTKSEEMLASIGKPYEPRFPDAISKNGIIKKLRFTQTQEKAKFSVQSDAQNTHDSGVTGTIRATLEKLSKVVTVTVSQEDVIEKLRTYCTFANEKGKLDKKQLSNAERVLDKMALNAEKLSTVDMSEAEILCLVYNRIHDEVNKDNRETMMENLSEELADSVDAEGYLYCTVGRISRLLNAVNVLDTAISIKPKWAIRQEMLQDASTVKESVLIKLPEKTRKKLDTDAEFSDKFDQRFRVFLRERFKMTYVDTNILSQKDLDKEVDEWIDYV